MVRKHLGSKALRFYVEADDTSYLYGTDDQRLFVLTGLILNKDKECEA